MHSELIINRIVKHAVMPNEQAAPKRSRAIIIDPEGLRFIGMARVRPNREPYISFPGGHVEPSDKTPFDTVEREIEEELTNIHPGDVDYRERILVYKDEFFYVGVLNKNAVELILGGPEGDGDPALYGTYDPRWLLIEYIPKLNLLPKEIAAIVTAAFIDLSPSS